MGYIQKYIHLNNISKYIYTIYYVLNFVLWKKKEKECLPYFKSKLYFKNKYSFLFFLLPQLSLSCV